ncbi:MAG: GH116 family glycosyl-hydrolase, partial [Armatimonadota bacterium]|nr:GH116 family glycosyl-hydrolase [Armatimonadota bacterium]
MMHEERWPVLTTYKAEHLTRIRFPLGGIGTGTVSLGGRGNLHDWEILNRAHKGFTPSCSFFTLWARAEGEEAVARVLEGEFQPPYDGAAGLGGVGAGLPRFRQVLFHAAYPFAQVELSDPAVPVCARLEAFNPMIPGDSFRSGLPVAVLRWVLWNPTRRPVEVAVAGSVENLVGVDGEAKPDALVNAPRKGEGFSGIFLGAQGGNTAARDWGSLALVAGGEGSYRTAWHGTGRWN